MTGRWFGRAALAVVVHPAIWGTAVAQLFRLAKPGWWRRWPPVPAPDPAYLRFRLQTQYGDTEREPSPGELVRYLRWVRSYRRVSR